MDYREYIESGILQDYCLGILPAAEQAKVEEVCRQHPEIKQELLQIQQSLEKQALENAVKPRAAVKGTIWAAMQLDEKEQLSLTNLPVIDRYTDSKKWLAMVQPLLPVELNEGESFSLVLQDTGKVMQKVLKSRKNYDYEVHHDLVENLLVLEGECTCEIDGKDYHFVTGDLIEIPLHIVHNLRVTTPHITLIVQHLAA